MRVSIKNMNCYSVENKLKTFIQINSTNLIIIQI